MDSATLLSFLQSPEGIAFKKKFTGRRDVKQTWDFVNGNLILDYKKGGRKVIKLQPGCHE